MCVDVGVAGAQQPTPSTTLCAYNTARPQSSHTLIGCHFPTLLPTAFSGLPRHKAQATNPTPAADHFHDCPSSPLPSLSPTTPPQIVAWLLYRFFAYPTLLSRFLTFISLAADSGDTYRPVSYALIDLTFFPLAFSPLSSSTPVRIGRRSSAFGTRALFEANT